MSKEILLVVDSVSNEKGVAREVIFQALEQALVAATKKRFDTDEINIRVSIDRKTGEYETFRFWEVVADEDHEIPAMQLAISDVEEKGLKLGDIVEEQIPSEEFGRIAAQTARSLSARRVSGDRQRSRRQRTAVHFEIGRAGPRVTAIACSGIAADGDRPQLDRIRDVGRPGYRDVSGAAVASAAAGDSVGAVTTIGEIDPIGGERSAYEKLRIAAIAVAALPAESP